MAANEIHIGDVGTIFEATVMDGTAVVDISGASTKNLIFTKPSGAKLTKAGSFTTNGTDGKLRYVSVAGDLDVTGEWKLQVELTLVGGSWHSDIKTFRVYANL